MLQQDIPEKMAQAKVPKSVTQLVPIGANVRHYNLF
jgi:hypothetical protein